MEGPEKSRKSYRKDNTKIKLQLYRYRFKEDSDESSSGQWIHENKSKRQIKYGSERMKEFDCSTTQENNWKKGRKRRNVREKERFQRPEKWKIKGKKGTVPLMFQKR